jgi:hypothetical protein
MKIQKLIALQETRIDLNQLIEISLGKTKIILQKKFKTKSVTSQVKRIVSLKYSKTNN